VGARGNVAAELVAERRAGAVAHGCGEIVAQLRRWIGEKRTNGSIAPIPEESVRGLSREDQTRKLEAVLKKLLAGPS
jgi:hypothetical protein